MRKAVSGLAALWLLAAPAFAADPPEAGSPPVAADNQAAPPAFVEPPPAEASLPAVDNQAAPPPAAELPPPERPLPAADNQAAPRPVEPFRPVTAPPAPAEPKRPPVYISMDFTDVDLPVLVKFISEQTKKNFIFDEKLQGKITIISPRRITVEEAYNVFLSVLQVKGFTTVEQGNTIKIVPLAEAKQEGLSTVAEVDSAAASEFITRLIPLQYVETAEVVALMTPLVSKAGLLTSFPASNTLIVIDSRANIDRILKILAVLDVEGATATLRIYPLKHASASDMAKTLELLYQEAAGAPGAPRRSRLGRTRGAPPKFIPDVRTNSLIALAGGEMQHDIADLIAKLDIPAPENTGKINVYYLENSEAEEVAKVLANLSERRPGPAQPAAPGAPPPTVKGVITAELEGGVKITADKATNSLVIIASINDYLTLVDVIKKLDIRRRQVYVESLIMEIGLNKGRDLGVEFRAAGETKDGAVVAGTNFEFAGNLNGLLGALATGNPLVFAGQGLIAAGIGGNVTLPDGTEIPAIAAVLRAAQNRDNINILSTPHLLTLDNKEAEIIVGQNVPFITSQTTPVNTTNLTNVVNTVERKDVGITLRMTPHIHESEYVNLDIYQESSAIVGTSILNIDQVGPTTTKRSARTSVLVRNGDTVVLGGMMQDTFNVIERQVPFLGDIPLIGNLFKFKSVRREKTNLLIFLTPHIMKAPDEMARATKDQQMKMDKFIEENRGEVERVLPEKKAK